MAVFLNETLNHSLDWFVQKWAQVFLTLVSDPFNCPSNKRHHVVQLCHHINVQYIFNSTRHVELFMYAGVRWSLIFICGASRHLPLWMVWSGEASGSAHKAPPPGLSIHLCLSLLSKSSRAVYLCSACLEGRSPKTHGWWISSKHAQVTF